MTRPSQLPASLTSYASAKSGHASPRPAATSASRTSYAVHV